MLRNNILAKNIKNGEDNLEQEIPIFDNHSSNQAYCLRNTSIYEKNNIFNGSINKLQFQEKVTARREQ